MKLFLSLVFFGFCQFAFGAGTISIPSMSCTISDPTVTTGTTSVTFVHVINFTDGTGSSSGRCYLELSDQTVTKGFTGGLQFATDLNSIKISGNAPRASSRNAPCGANDFLTSPNVSGRTGWQFRSTAPSNGAAANFCTLSYTIPLMLDNTSPNPTNSLCPKITMTVQNVIVTNSLSEGTISFPCATPPITPQLTCSLSVPTNLLLGTAKPDAWRPLLDTSRVNATNFNIAINCSQKLTTKFTPTVTMKFETPLGTTCFAKNELTSADATDATIEIIRDLQGFTQVICPTTATSPTTLAFKVNDPASTPQPYSDSITLQAAFRGASGDRRPKTGPFSTRVTFTVKYE